MADMSNALEKKLGDHTLLGTASTAPSGHKVHLYTAVTDAEAGTGTEATGGGYAAQDITFEEVSNGVYANDAPVTFTASGAAFSAGAAITHFAVRDGAGVALSIIKALANGSRVVNDGDSLTFDTGELTFSFA